MVTVETLVIALVLRGFRSVTRVLMELPGAALLARIDRPWPVAIPTLVLNTLDFVWPRVAATFVWLSWSLIALPITGRALPIVVIAAM